MADGPVVSQIARLVVDHHADVYRYAYRLAGSSVDAEDLTQQTFLAAQLKLAQLRSSDTARAWLFTILRNCYLKSRRGVCRCPPAAWRWMSTRSLLMARPTGPSIANDCRRRLMAWRMNTSWCS